MDLINTGLLKNPGNWLVVWTMLALGWFLYKTIKKALPSQTQ